MLPYNSHSAQYMPVYPRLLLGCRLPSRGMFTSVSWNEDGGKISRLLMFNKAAWWFKELNTLLAFTSNTASESSAAKAMFMAWTAASVPAI